jgi:hypothetical protein
MPRPNSTLSPKTVPLLDSDVIVRNIVAFNSPGVIVGTSQFRIGRVAAGSEIIGGKIKTPTAWAGGGLTAGTLSVGTIAGSYVDILPATSVFAVAGTLVLAGAAAALEFLTDTDIWAQLILTTGTGPTAGLTA